MIEKELLREVLGVSSIFRVMDYADKTGINVQVKEFGRWQKINIYELAHKCKEWALTKKMYLSVICGKFVTEVFIHDDGNDNKIHTILSATEPEAIFKACEWILKQKDKHEQI